MKASVLKTDVGATPPWVRIPPPPPAENRPRPRMMLKKSGSGYRAAYRDKREVKAEVE